MSTLSGSRGGRPLLRLTAPQERRELLAAVWPRTTSGSCGVWRRLFPRSRAARRARGSALSRPAEDLPLQTLPSPCHCPDSSVKWAERVTRSQEFSSVQPVRRPWEGPARPELCPQGWPSRWSKDIKVQLRASRTLPRRLRLTRPRGGAPPAAPANPPSLPARSPEPWPLPSLVCGPLGCREQGALGTTRQPL